MSSPVRPADAAHRPAVSIVVPLYNDEEHVREAIDSCLAQSDADYEIVAVDDFSSDGTPAILRELAATHPQLRVITLESNSTAFQARRVGVRASRGSYVMFLDGDDVLSPHAVAAIRRHGRSSADMIHFGTSIVGRDGSRHRGFEAKLQPRVSRLRGSDIFAELFLSRGSLEGHLWNKAYRAEFAKPVFDSFPEAVRVPRANDLPVSLLLAARAESYVSTREKLYTYHYGSGEVSDRLLSAEQFARVADFRPSFDVIEGALRDGPLGDEVTTSLLNRLSAQFIARCLRFLGQLAQPSGDALDLLLSHWPAPEVLSQLFGQFRKREPELLPFAFRSTGHERTQGVEPTTIALYLDQRGVGGMQRVVSLQAQLLVRAGYRVVILGPMDLTDFPYPLPESSIFVPLASTGRRPQDALRDLMLGMDAAIAEHGIDTVILHSNYRQELLYLVLMLERLPVTTVLTMHNFALRAVLDRSSRFGFLRAAALRSNCLAVLSETDVAFWQLAGVERVCYVPNPIDFSLAEADPASDAPRECDVLWYGRLNEGTKRVSETLRVFALVAQMRPGARLHIVGPVPGSQQGSLRSLQALAATLGIADSVEFRPSVSDVGALLSSTSVVLSTSLIEGFQLTLVESVLAGRPVVMYELPYLETSKDNPAIVAVPWGDRQAAADQVVALLDDASLRRAVTQAGTTVLREQFSDDLVCRSLRTAFELGRSSKATVDHTQTVVPQLEQARVLVQQLFPLFQASVTAGGRADSAHEIESFYRTWYGSRTIRYSIFVGRPIIAVRRALRFLRDRAGARRARQAVGRRDA